MTRVTCGYGYFHVWHMTPAGWLLYAAWLQRHEADCIEADLRAILE